MRFARNDFEIEPQYCQTTLIIGIRIISISMSMGMTLYEYECEYATMDRLTKCCLGRYCSRLSQF